ncbi:reverse transcriptase, partial [Globisporangium splendens]
MGGGELGRGNNGRSGREQAAASSTEDRGHIQAPPVKRSNTMDSSTDHETKVSAKDDRQTQTPAPAQGDNPRVSGEAREDRASWANTPVDSCDAEQIAARPLAEMELRVDIPDAMCGHTKETIPHIMWDCNRARAVWRLLFEKWTGHQANETLRDMMLPHIASRKPPSSTRSIRQRILARFGFFTPEHAHALKTIWFIVCSVIPSCLWRQRNATVHERLKASVVDCRDHTWRTCVRQVMAVTRKRRRMRGKAFESIAMREIIQVLDQPEEALEAPGWNNARLYFDGGARGNPGPGGSGWALVTQDAQSLEWSVTACGYKYKGSYVTNNVCEYGALQDGVEYARTALEGTHTHLAIHGDSNMIIDERNGLATITAPQLQKHAVAVDNIVSHLAWASWTHVRREHNKMADFLANVAMDSRGRRTLTPSTRDSEATRFHQVQTLMKNDMNCVASQIRTGSLTRVIKRFLDS